MRIHTYIYCISLFLIFCPDLAAQKQNIIEKTIHQEENIILMSGQKIGKTQSIIYKSNQGYRVVEHTQIEMKRGDQRIKMQTNLESKADSNWKSISFDFTNTSPQAVMKSHGELSHKNPQRLIVTSFNDGVKQRKEIQIKADTRFASLLSAQMKINMKTGYSCQTCTINSKKHLEKIKEMSGSHSVFLEDMGVLTELNIDIRKLNPEEWSQKTNQLGKYAVALLEIKSSMKGIESKEIRDFEGRFLESKTPAMQAESYPKDIYLKTIQFRNSGQKSNKEMDIMAKSTWPAIDVPQNPSELLYRVTTKDAYKFAVPEDDRQKIIFRNKNRIDVRVRGKVAQNIKNHRLFSKDADLYLEESKYEAIHDERIKNLAMILTIGLLNDYDKIEVLNHFVHHHINNKTLDRSYAPALETLKTKAGDCTEHSVLLSALLKSQGIPTKIVDGVVVTGEILGYHEWLEVYVKGQGFIPTDPTFDAFPANVRRFKLAEGSTSAEGLMQLALGASRILQPGLTIEIIKKSN